MRCVPLLWAVAFLLSKPAGAAYSPQAMVHKSLPKITETKFVSSQEFEFKPAENVEEPRSIWDSLTFGMISKLWREDQHTDEPVYDLALIVSKNLIIKEDNRPTFSQHASTIVEIAPGEMLAAWFGGSWEKNPDVGIWMSRYKDGEWSDTPWEVVKPVDAVPTWNPVLFKVPATGEVLLFYKVGEDPEVWEGRMIRSKDNGHSWGPTEQLPSGMYGPVKNKPIVLKDGTILAGGSDEVNWTVHVEYSRDNGYTWHRTSAIPFAGKILQPAMYVDGSGRARMLCRSNNDRLNKRYVNNNVVLIQGDRSGLKWSKGVRTNAPNPNAGLDAVRLRDGRLLMVYNPNNDGAQRARATLAIAVSRDEGHSWRLAGQLERVDVAPRPYTWPEYSYPAVIQAEDGKVHITYTYTYEVQRRGLEGRENIMHAVVDVLDLERQ